MTASRGQANLPALAVALLLVGASVGVAVALAGGAFAAANTDAQDTRLVSSLAERLVAADGPLSVRANVLSRDAVENASGGLCPGAADCQLRLDGETVAARGDPKRGETVRRIVLVADTERRTLDAALSGKDAVTLPRRTANATVRLDPPTGTRVTTVRANDRVVLHDPGGLDGRYDLALSRYDTVTLALDANRDLGPRALTVGYRVETTSKAVLEVTVDA
ncbi:DUF7263 family protein [Halobacterium jilantaiense]|uniref:Uncharacterized protein n=1 Tax=Halobacterium jilantaiense TaxID=355548 RepID=A0A1I0P1R4_9EURY|nr:hypothetical protein [Halobacterium jilantaiense]SEW08066.1 hypothetical protein SAMN04487945_1326 [Halobacterium jilantaiense]